MIRSKRTPTLFLGAAIVALPAAIVLPGSSADARVFNHGGQGIQVTTDHCPLPDDADSGCEALYLSGLQGTIQYPNCFTTDTTCGPGSGQKGLDGVTTGYKSRLNKNQAGVDFPVGVPQIYINSLLDPKLFPPTNCVYGDTTSAAGTPRLTCGGGPVQVWGYEFGPVGGHGATVLRVNSNSVTPSIRYSHFGSDAGVVSASLANDYAINAVQGSTYDFEFSYNTVDAGCTHWDCTPCCYQFVIYTSGAKTLDYDALIHMPVRITAGCASTQTCTTVGDWNFKHSFVLGHDMTAALHGELVEEIMSQKADFFSIQNHTNYIGDVIIQPNTAARQTTANIYVSGGAAPTGPPTYSDVNVRSSTLICNNSPDWPSGSGGPGYICSANIDFQNGVYTNVHFTDVAMDSTGSISNLRADGDQLQFTGVIDADGTLHVTDGTGPFGGGGYIYADPHAGSSKIWFDGGPSGITINREQVSDGPIRGNLVNPSFNGKVLTFDSYTSTGIYCKPTCAIQPGDLITMPGVAPMSQFISSCGTNCWNSDVDNGTLSASAGTVNVSGYNGTYTTIGSTGAVSSRTMVAYGGREQAAFPNSVIMSNVFDMTKAAGSNQITTFDFLTGGFYVQKPPG